MADIYECTNLASLDRLFYAWLDLFELFYFLNLYYQENCSRKVLGYFFLDAV